MPLSAKNWFCFTENAKAALIARGNLTPTDQQIFDEMLGVMQPGYDFASDYTGCRAL